MKLLIITLISIMSAFAFDDAKLPAALSESETKEIFESVLVNQQAYQLLKQRENEALNGSLDRAAELLGNWQSAFFKTELAKRESEKIMTKHRAAHNCPECLYSEDYKSLIRQKK